MVPILYDGYKYIRTNTKENKKKRKKKKYKESETFLRNGTEAIKSPFLRAA